MEFRFRLVQILAFLLIALAFESHAAPSTEEYWTKIMPNTLMPKTIHNFLQSDGITVSVGGPVNVGVNIDVPTVGVSINMPMPSASVGVGISGAEADVSVAKSGKGADVSVGKPGKDGKPGKGVDVSVGKPGKGVDVSVGKPGKGVDVSVGKPGKDGKPGKGVDVSVGKPGKGVDVSVGKPGKGVDVSVGKPGKDGKPGKGVYVSVGKPGKGVDVSVEKPGKGEASVSDNHVAVNDNLDIALVFLEKDIKHGNQINMHVIKSSYRAPILPRPVAESIPFSSEKMTEVYHRLNVKPSSKEAEIMAETVKMCEAKGIDGEEKYCATSLESMLDYATSKLGKKVDVVTTFVEKETKSSQKYIFTRVSKVLGTSTMVCDKMNYAYGVFYCHKIGPATTYNVSLVGADGTKVKAAMLCNNVKQGTTPVCQFLPEDHIVWVSK